MHSNNIMENLLTVSKCMNEPPTIGNLSRIFGQKDVRKSLTWRNKLLLLFAGARIQVAIRFDDENKIRECLIQIIVRAIFLSPRNGSLARAMRTKFPAHGCGYCRHKPCQCKSNRPRVDLVPVQDSLQDNWTLDDWAYHIELLYGRQNAKQGLDNLLTRLFSEIAEFDALTAAGQKNLEGEVCLELADILSWTFSIMNRFNYRPNQLLEEYFLIGCKDCKLINCQCWEFSIKN